MLPTHREANDLDIDLDCTPKYELGGTITGRVIRRTFIITPHAYVTLRLYARAHSTVEKWTSDTSKTYTSDFMLFELVTPPIFQGPIHVANGGPCWQVPFSIQIPTRPWPAVGLDKSHRDSFLPLDQAEVARHALPSSFHCYDNSDEYENIRCFVEYVFEAYLHYNHGKIANLSRATRPITVQPAPGRSVTDYNLQCTAHPLSLRSQRLLPGMATADLSFKEKTLKLLHSSKVPKLSGVMYVETPRIMQLGAFFPFRVRVALDHAASSDRIAMADLLICLVSLRLDIQSRTDTIGLATWTRHEAHAATPHEFTIAPREVLPIPSGSDGWVLDIGARMDLHIHAREVVHNEAVVALGDRIYPDFTTYNIRHTNWLKWKMIVNIANERCVFKGLEQLQVVEAPVA